MPRVKRSDAIVQNLKWSKTKGPRTGIETRIIPVLHRTRGNQVPRGPLAELVEDAVAVRLLHLSVDVEARITELGNLLGEKLHAVHRVAEND